LKGEEIQLGARIFAVADTLDAITSDRPYRSARPYSVARKEIEAGSGKQFDPAVVEAFLQIEESVWQVLREKSTEQRSPLDDDDVGEC
jgi:HD-GYP domain-containing protein (c-di-GMP phosphodiesterase class II)